MNVTNADFHVYVSHSYYATTANGLWLDTVNSSWSAGSLTWNNKPASTNIASVNVMRDQWANFDVSSTVKAWVDGTKSNYGFKLHTNGNGQTYWKKVVSSTNSTLKPYLSVDYTIPAPETPTGKVVSNGDGTGYIDLSWKPVTGATSYKVWMYNGKDYEFFRVGNVTSWSTKGQRIWPTQAEIDAKSYDLHYDQKGAELPIDPSPVYKNSGGIYPNNKNYWFRVSAIFDQGESAQSGYYAPTIPNLSKPEAPTGLSYSNGDGTGYFDLSWTAVTGATGYRLLMFNGSEYEEKDVGNVTSWTTKGRKYWPTAAEIAAGRYKLHLNDNPGTTPGNGAELSLTPSKVYANAGTLYANHNDYIFRVIAYNTQGETINSDYYPRYIPNLTIPTISKVLPYANKLGSNSGYIKLNWDSVTNATGYKIWIYNGSYYESFDVGNVTTWSTQNKKIWPNNTEIANKKLSDGSPLHFHTEKIPNGEELPLDPSSMYAAMYPGTGVNYGTRKDYYFRITAYNEQGETIFPNTYYTNNFPESTEFLGKEDYWSFIDVPYGSVNVATGNLVIHENDISIEGRGPSFGVGRTYNSLSPNVGLFGKGWHSDAEMSITPTSTGVKFIDEDATEHLFTKLSDGTYQAPTGVYLELKETSDEYILTEKDQSQYHFSKAKSGKIDYIDDGQNLGDGHGNKVTYGYNSNGQLTSITDASQRTITIEYNSDGLIKDIKDPSNRVFSYNYNGDLLTGVINPEGGMTQYEYDDDNHLVKVYEPTHSDDNPVINQFIYTDGKVTTAINPDNKAYVLSYDNLNSPVTVKNPNGKRDQYAFNLAANPTKIIQDLDGLKITTSYTYDGNNLIDSRDPNDQNATNPTESNTYDGNGNVLTSTDKYGTESYQYNSNNDVTSMVDTENDETTFAYSGLNPVSETDQEGKVASISKYDNYGNVTESSSSLGAATNLLLNSNFENGTTSWALNQSNDKGTISTEKNAIGLNGTQALKLNAQSSTVGTELGYMAATQEISVQPNTTYTLSSKTKSTLSKANAFLNVLYIGGPTNKWADNRYSQMSGSRPWTNRQLTFTTASDTNKIRIYLEVDHHDPAASGSAWFDGVQLEKTEVTSSYNPILNSSFENSFNNWSGSGGTNDSSAFDGSKSLKIVRTSPTQASSIYTQTLTIGQDTSSNPFNITLTGLSKSENVKANGSVALVDYSVSAKVYYADGTFDNTFSAGFPVGTQDWNRSALLIPATKPISKIDVSVIFQGNYTGTVWFDAIRLLEGNVLTHNQYDDKGHNYIAKVEDELGNSISKEYDTIGNLKTETDANGNVKSYGYDLMNRLNNLLLPNGTTIVYGYDKNGNMKTKTLTAIDSIQGTKVQKFSYDYYPSGLLKQSTGPLNDITTNEYNDNGKISKIVLPSGKIMEWGYDGTDRVKDESYNGIKWYSYTYDNNGNEKTVSYEKENRIKSREFDPYNRLKSLTDRGGIQSWVYPTDSDKLKSTTFLQGSFSQTNTYSYNDLDQNTSVNDGVSTYRFDYDERGNLRTFTSGNGSGSTFNYDDRGQISNLNVGTPDGTEMINESYRYDKNGNRTHIDFTDGSTIAYEYGELNQLTKETLRDGTINQYHYDSFGNRDEISVTKNGETSPTKSQFNTANQLTQFGDEVINYDADGNRTSDGKYSYGWNEANQLVSITKKGESSPFVTYKYDEEGRRIQKSVDGTITNYHYDGDSINLLYESDAQENVLRSYIYSQSGQLLAMQKGSKKYFYHMNAHGDVIALTNSSGAVVATYDYDAWGNPIKTTENDEVKDNPFRYAGYQYDQETGNYYLIARYYQPKQGVFLSLDPEPGDSDDIVTQNGYTYGNDNPVMYVDPDGNKSLLVSALFVILTKTAIYFKKSNSLVKKAIVKLLGKGTGKVSKYEDVTKSGSRYANRATDVTKVDFEKNLLKDGWKKTASKDGKTTILTKDGAKYVLRDGAKSTGGPTADFYPSGSKGFTLKIRLK